MSQVISEKNLGEHLYEKYGNDTDMFKKVLSLCVLEGKPVQPEPQNIWIGISPAKP